MDIDYRDPIEATVRISPPFSQYSSHVTTQDPQPDSDPFAINQVTSPPEAPALPTDEPVLNKVHIRGLDDLTTKDIESFSIEHFPSHKPKVEWVDGEQSDTTTVNTIFMHDSHYIFIQIRPRISSSKMRQLHSKL